MRKIILTVAAFCAVTPAMAFDMASFKSPGPEGILAECEAQATADKNDIKLRAEQVETCRKGIQDAANDMILVLVSHSSGADSWKTAAVVNACGNKFPGKVIEIDVPKMTQCLKENLE